MLFEWENERCKNITFEKYSMEDLQIRLGILNYLKTTYDGSPHSYVQREKILESGEVTAAELDRNIKYLQEKGLMDVQWFLGGSFICKINSFGIDEVERIQREIADSQEENVSPQEVVPTIIDESKTFVDSKLEGIAPEILVKLQYTYADLINKGPDYNYSRIAYDCREVLMDFTEALFKEEYVEDKQLRPTRTQTKNKLRAIVKQFSNSETTSTLVAERFNYVLDYFDALNDYIQKNTHPDGFKVSPEEAKTCLIYTYLLMRDILLFTGI